MRTRLLTVLPVLVLGLVSACSGLGGTGELEYVGGDGRIVQVPSEERVAPVAVAGETLQGAPLDLADLRGEVVVVNVWWSGCGPCRTEMPMLVEASRELDAEFVGINIRDNAAAGAAFERELGVDYPSIEDPGSEALLGFGQRYAPRSMPSTAVLDREGRVAALISGEIPSALTLAELVEEIAAEDVA
ncbi:MAG: TlpA disulfide reductase family protein [Nocardioides sp.]